MKMFSILFRFYKKKQELTKVFTRMKPATKFPAGTKMKHATLVLIKTIETKKECQEIIDLLENLKPSLNK